MIKRFDVQDGDGKVFLTRWTLPGFRGWKPRIHLMRAPDGDRCPHDHPWPFWTLVLWGGYVEKTPEGVNHMRPGRFAYRPATYQHQVASLPRGVAVTLVLTGPQERDWGFWRGKEWVHWREFVGLSNKLRALWCEEGKVTMKDVTHDP